MMITHFIKIVPMAFIVMIMTITGSNVFAYQTQILDMPGSGISSDKVCPSKNRHVLNCPTYHQTTNYTCGPAAVMAVMRYYGKLKASDFNQRTELTIAREMSAAPGDSGGTTIGQMSSWLSNHGFSVETGENINTDAVIDYINKRVPVIIGFNNHWIVAKGYNKGGNDTYQNQDEILFSDSCCDVSVISRDDLDSTWQVSHMQNRRCNGNGEYIVAIPTR